MKRCPDKNFGYIDLKSLFWTQSLFRRMGYRKHAASNGKVNVPEAVRKEVEVKFLYEIVNKVENYKIPLSLVFNLDQTSPKSALGSKSTQ